MTEAGEPADTDRTDLDRATVERMVAAVEPAWTVERARPSDEGTDYVYFVTVRTPEGKRETVLKAFAGEAAPAAVARSEPRVLELLAAETEIPVPAVVGFVDDHPDLPAPFFLAERLPGENGAGQFTALSTPALDRVLADAGDFLGQLHALGSFDRFGRVGVADGRLAVVDDADTGGEWTDWLLADAEETLDGLDGGRFDDLVPALRGFVRDAIPALDAPETASLVHWDYRLGNLLVDPESGETTAVLDWAGLLAGDPVYNLATVEDHNVNWQTRDVVLRRRLRDRFYEAYGVRRGDWPADFRERKRVYHLCNRLNAMACLPDWYADADPAIRDERAAEHRTFVREYLE